MLRHQCQKEHDDLRHQRWERHDNLLDKVRKLLDDEGGNANPIRRGRRETVRVTLAEIIRSVLSAMGIRG